MLGMTTENLSPSAQAPAAVVEGDEFTFTRAASIVPNSFNEAENTIDVCFSTGARGLRYDWATDQVYDEELEISTRAVDLTRFDAGVVQVLNNHNAYSLESVLGIATRGWIAGTEARATLKLSQRDEIKGLVSDIRAGIIRAISVGYRVMQWAKTTPDERTDGVRRTLMTATRWMPHEISFVGVPFDAGSSSRSLAGPGPAATSAAADDGTPVLDAAAAAWLASRALAGSAGQGGTAPGAAAAQRAPHPFSPAIARALGAADGAPVSSSPAALAIHPQESSMTDQVRTQGAASATPTPAELAATQAEALRQANAAMLARAADISQLCVRHGAADLAPALIRDNKSLEQASAAILDHLALRDAAAGGHTNVSRVQTLNDEGETRARGIEEALLTRVDGKAKLSENGRRFRSLTLLELGRGMLANAGVDTRGMDRMEIATRMLSTRGGGMQTTGDFPSLLGNVANKRMRMGYEENPGTYGRWARRAPNAPDFKAMSVVQMSSMPDLLKVNEAGEFKYAKLVDGAESYGLSTYGIVVPFSRQAIINDDLRGFDRMINGFGASSARLENRVVYAQLTANAAMADTVALFHATHANLGTGGGSALSFDALKAGRLAMRLQKGLQAEELNIAPAYMIVPAALEQTAYQLTSSNYTPATKAEVNEFRAGGRTAVDPIIEPILDAVSATAWYLAAANSQVDTVEYCWLDGAEGPVVEQSIDFDVDGIKFRCREDFAAKPLDFRGLYKANGA